MKKSFLFLLFALTLFPLFPQESPADNADAPGTEILPSEQFPADELSLDDASSLDDGDIVFVIDDFEFDIKGRTRPDAILNISNKSGKKEFQKGEELRGWENLELYIAEKTQVLVNQRVLKDNALIEYSIGEPREDATRPVTLIIQVEDTWNVIALPRPAYKSDTGWDITIKARDYNFLGTMNPLRIDLGYKYDENHRHSFDFLIDTNTPFTAFGLNWNIDFDNLFRYRPNVEEPFYYQNISGLSVELPIRKTTLTIGFAESVNLNEENPENYYEGPFQTGVFMSSRPFTSWKIPTGLLIAEYGELTYTPGVSARFNHEFPQWPLQDIRKGPVLDFSHSLGFEKIDWHSNFREGLSVSLSNSFSYDFFRLKNNQEPLSSSVAFTGIGHFIIREFFAISTRIAYRYWYAHDPEYNEYAADALRGIADREITADHRLSLNMDFPFRVLLFTPSEWFNTKKLRFFDFEMQFSPVIDTALYHDPRTETSFSFKNMAFSGGMEAIVFPLSFRALYVRMGFAWNLRELFTARPFKLPDGNNREIYLMMGHFY